MINIISNSGQSAYGIQHLVVDEHDEIKQVNPVGMSVGSTVFCIATSKYYMLNSAREWKNVELNGAGGSGEDPDTETIIYEGGVV